MRTPIPIPPQRSAPISTIDGDTYQSAAAAPASPHP
jgi:hypothetical protein